MEEGKVLRQLASVKHQLYHPQLPSLRRMDMDTVAHRLSSEHSRHTTSCRKGDFTKIRTTRYPCAPNLHCKSVIASDTKEKVDSYETLENASHTEKWNKIPKQMRKEPAPVHHTNEPKHTNVMHPVTSNLYIRKLHPEITSSWKVALTVKDKPHHLLITSERPMPATIYHRYRTLRRPYSAYPWY